MTYFQAAIPEGRYKWRGAIRVIREKPLSSVKRLARCSSAMAAINVSIVAKLMPFGESAAPQFVSAKDSDFFEIRSAPDSACQPTDFYCTNESSFLRIVRWRW